MDDAWIEAAIAAQVQGINSHIDWPDARLVWPDDWDEAGRATYRTGMRAALTAVLPLIRAKEAEECAKVADEVRQSKMLAISNAEAAKDDLAGMSFTAAAMTAYSIASAIRARHLEGEMR